MLGHSGHRIKKKTIKNFNEVFEHKANCDLRKQRRVVENWILILFSGDFARFRCMCLFFFYGCLWASKAMLNCLPQSQQSCCPWHILYYAPCTGPLFLFPAATVPLHSLTQLKAASNTRTLKAFEAHVFALLCVRFNMLLGIDIGKDGSITPIMQHD